METFFLSFKQSYNEQGMESWKAWANNRRKKREGRLETILVKEKIQMIESHNWVSFKMEKRKELNALESVTDFY